MMTSESGQIRFGAVSRVPIHTREDRNYLCHQDLGPLVFLGDSMLFPKKGPAPQVHEVCGRVRFPPSGWAVVITMGKQQRIIPRDKFLAIAFREEFFLTFFEVPAGGLEIEPVSLHKRGITV